MTALAAQPTQEDYHDEHRDVTVATHHHHPNHHKLQVGLLVAFAIVAVRIIRHRNEKAELLVDEGKR